MLFLLNANGFEFVVSKAIFPTLTEEAGTVCEGVLTLCMEILGVDGNTEKSPGGPSYFCF
jgi:hypothetical protein